MPEPVKSEQPQVPEQLSNPSPENLPNPTLSDVLSDMWRYVKSHFKVRTWAGWIAFIYAVIPDTQSHITAWAGYLELIGGHAAMLSSVLEYARPVPAMLGIFYIVIISYLVEIRKARQWMPLAAWTVLIVFAIAFGSLTLFVDFVQSINIPGAMAYFAEKGSVRTLSEQQSSQLKKEIQDISG